MIWIYNGVVFDEQLIDKNAGFVYLVTNNITGMKYIGKKVFYFTRKTNSSKEKRKIVKIDSGWRDYYGSGEEILLDVEKYRK